MDCLKKQGISFEKFWCKQDAGYGRYANNAFSIQVILLSVNNVDKLQTCFSVNKRESFPTQKALNSPHDTIRNRILV